MAAHNHSRRTKIKKPMITPTNRKQPLWVSVAWTGLLDINQQAVTALYYKFKWQIITGSVSIFQTAHTQKRPDAYSERKLRQPRAAKREETLQRKHQREVLEHINTIEGGKETCKIIKTLNMGPEKCAKWVSLIPFSPVAPYENMASE